MPCRLPLLACTWLTRLPSVHAPFAADDLMKLMLQKAAELKGELRTGDVSVSPPPLLPATPQRGCTVGCRGRLCACTWPDAAGSSPRALPLQVVLWALAKLGHTTGVPPLSDTFVPVSF